MVTENCISLFVKIYLCQVKESCFFWNIEFKVQNIANDPWYKKHFPLSLSLSLTLPLSLSLSLSLSLPLSLSLSPARELGLRGGLLGSPKLLLSGPSDVGSWTKIA